MHTHLTAPTMFTEVDGVAYAYRRFGRDEGTPLLFLQHFSGGLDHWDPAVTDGLGDGRPVILFDNAGMGASGGETPKTIEAMAEHVFRFVSALELSSFDLLGFSIGGMVAQACAIEHPDFVRRLVLVGTRPRGGEPSPYQREVAERLQGGAGSEANMLWLFFGRSDAAKEAGHAFWIRRHARKLDSDPRSPAESLEAQGAALRDWLEPHGERFADLKRITAPTLVVNGTTDVMTATINSWHLQQNIPRAQLIIYPDAGHGSLFQYPELFVRHVALFLEE